MSETEDTPKLSWWKRLSGGLKRTSSSLGTAVADLVTKRKLDRAMLDDIEDVLLRADLGTEVAVRIADAVGAGRYDKAISADEVKSVVATEVEKVLAPVAKPLEIDAAQKPFVILVVGVNGSGKTTTIGKLAAKFAAEGRKVMGMSVFSGMITATAIGVLLIPAFFVLIEGRKKKKKVATEELPPANTTEGGH